MSYGYQKKETQYDAPKLTCGATGCPCVGVIKLEGGLLCSYHGMAEPDSWPRLTEAIRTNQHILEAISQIIKTDDVTWGTQGCHIFKQYFEREPHLMPSEHECERRPWYEYRLRNELLFLGGVVKRPKVRTMEVEA